MYAFAPETPPGLVGRNFCLAIEALAKVVILVKTGIQFLDQTRDLLDSRRRGNDGHWIFGFLQELTFYDFLREHHSFAFQCMPCCLYARQYW